MVRDLGDRPVLTQLNDPAWTAGKGAAMVLDAR